jgi:hypothetical protein
VRVLGCDDPTHSPSPSYPLLPSGPTANFLPTAANTELWCAPVKGASRGNKFTTMHADS